MGNRNAIRAIEGAATSPTILGVYEGECADATITNENGLDITREVWENVFDSEDYRKGIEHGWFIGFLGHPEDPGCQEFKDGCIIMTEGHIDADGKVYGKFNLVDTPVGRIIKTYIDAGVEFGISVRGAGDIVDNSVDPDTFVFRGFDLVAFPAFPDSIPTFSEIAASTDVSKRMKYKAVCAAVDTNVANIRSTETLKQLKSSFAPQSKQFKEIEQRISELQDDEDLDLQAIQGLKLSCMTDMYLDAVETCRQLQSENDKLKNSLRDVKASYDRKVRIMNRVMGAQQSDLSRYCDKLEADRSSLSSKLLAANKKNLTYECKINASSETIKSQRRKISDLEHELNETVAESQGVQKTSSNLEGELATLRSEVTATKKMLAEYQNAYASLYAAAAGVDLSNVPITASTSLKSLQSMIQSSSAVSGTFDTSDFDVSTSIEYSDIDDSYGLITI